MSPTTPHHLLMPTTEPTEGEPSQLLESGAHSHLPEMGNEAVRDQSAVAMMDRSSLFIESMADDGHLASTSAQMQLHMRQMPVWGAVVNSIAFMAVPRSIPACFAATGWTIGIGSLFYSSIVTYDTGLLLGQVCNALPANSVCSFPALAAHASERFACHRNWSRSAQRRARKVGHVAIACLQYSCYYLTGVAELIYFEQYLGQYFSLSPLCQWQWLLIVGVISLPVVQVPSFHATRIAAVALGVLPLVLNVGVMLYEIALVRPWDCAPGPSYTAWPSVSRGFVGLTAFAYAFGGHGLYPDQIREMRQPARWPSVMAWTYAATVPLYWLCGLLGYYAYGDFSKANINLNFPDNPANKLSIAVQALQEFFFILDSDLVVMLAMELAVGLDPSTCCAPTWHPRTWRRGLPPWLGRLGLRSAFLASQVFCAQMLLSGEGDTLLSLQALTASVGMVAFTYFLPYVFALLLSPTPLGPWRKAWAGVNIAIGLAMAVGGFGSSLGELLEGSTGLFNGDCKLQWAYAPQSPGDPCNLSGIPSEGGMQGS
jgi:proton-coupled amino acid transporter